MEDSRVSGVHKGTVVRGESDFPSGALHITDCHDTVIYALAPLQVRGDSLCVECAGTVPLPLHTPRSVSPHDEERESQHIL